MGLNQFEEIQKMTTENSSELERISLEDSERPLLMKAYFDRAAAGEEPKVPEPSPDYEPGEDPYPTSEEAYPERRAQRRSLLRRLGSAAYGAVASAGRGIADVGRVAARGRDHLCNLPTARKKISKAARKYAEYAGRLKSKNLDFNGIKVDETYMRGVVDYWKQRLQEERVKAYGKAGAEISRVYAATEGARKAIKKTAKTQAGYARESWAEAWDSYIGKPLKQEKLEKVIAQRIETMRTGPERMQARLEELEAGGIEPQQVNGGEVLRVAPNVWRCRIPSNAEDGGETGYIINTLTNKAYRYQIAQNGLGGSYAR